MNGDGISYLDLGEAFLHGQWSALSNGYWSPLYGVLIALAEHLGHWAGLPIYAGIQLFNLLTFVIDVFLLDALMRTLAGDRVAVRVFALGLFATIAVQFHLIWFVTPDLLLAGLLLAAFRETVGALDTGWTVRHTVFVGLLLGVAYWTKAVAFPFAVLFLATAFWVSKRDRLIGIAALVWLAMVLPLVGAVNLRLNKLSFGDSGRLNYLWFENGLPNRLWVGGTEEHPLKRIHRDPDIFAFGDVMPEATYPLWYDPSYFYAGVEAHVDWKLWGEAIWQNVRIIGGGYLSFWLLTFLAIAGAGSLRFREAWFERPGLTVLSVPCMIQLVLLLGVHAESRFLTAQFMVLLTLPALMMAPRVLLLVGVAGLLGASYSSVDRAIPDSTMQVAAALRAGGVGSGESVCVIADRSAVASPVKVVGARIVAQMRLADYRGVLAESAVEAFWSTGCVVVLAASQSGEAAEILRVRR